MAAGEAVAEPCRNGRGREPCSPPRVSAVRPSAVGLPGTPGIYFEYSHRSMSLVRLACCFLGALGAVQYFFVRVGGPGRPLGAEWPLFEEITRPALLLLFYGRE